MSGKSGIKLLRVILTFYHITNDFLGRAEGKLIISYLLSCPMNSVRRIRYRMGKRSGLILVHYQLYRPPHKIFRMSHHPLL